MLTLTLICCEFAIVKNQALFGIKSFSQISNLCKTNYIYNIWNGHTSFPSHDQDALLQHIKHRKISDKRYIIGNKNAYSLWTEAGTYVMAMQSPWHTYFSNMCFSDITIIKHIERKRKIKYNSKFKRNLGWSTGAKYPNHMFKWSKFLSFIECLYIVVGANTQKFCSTG